MSKIEKATKDRKVLLSNGFEPHASKDKICRIRGWNSVLITEALIDKWSRSTALLATVIRLPGLAMTDVDVPDPTASRAITDALEPLFPAGILLERGTTASCKVAFLNRAETAFGYYCTRRYRTPDAQEDDDDQFVEIFAPQIGSIRYMGAFGPHDLAKGSEYVWLSDATPLNTKKDDLPVLTEAMAAALIAKADETFLALGYLPIDETTSGKQTGGNAYDLRDDMRFDCKDGTLRSLAEMKQALAGRDSLRCSASFINPTSRNKEVCQARLDHDGYLLVTDYHDHVRHREKAAQGTTPEELAEHMAEYAEARQQPPKEPPFGDKAKAKADEIRAQYAFCRSMERPVVPLDATSLTGGIGMKNFALSMLPFVEVRFRGPNGGIKEVIDPVALWLAREDRILIEGLQMRPDQPEQLFQEDGKWWLNIYTPPVFDQTGGDATLLIQFMSQLVPDDASRAYFLQWLAYKFRNPSVPGCGIVMVAREKYGTGRGRFAKLLGKLFGAAYVRRVPFHIFAGKSYQSQYNGYAATALFAIVNETQELNGNPKWSVGHDTYAHIREQLEPSAEPREIILQGVIARQMLSFMSAILMLNDISTIPVPEGDRRLVVFENGEPQPEEYWIALEAAMADPANIAAFARWLLGIDLTSYNPFATPPMTAAKRDMAWAGMSDLEQTLEDVLAYLKGRSEIFSLWHILIGMHALNHPDHLPQGWEQAAQKIVGKRFFRIGERDGTNNKPRFGKGRYPAYAWTAALAKKWAAKDSGLVKVELYKAGADDGIDYGNAVKDFGN